MTWLNVLYAHKNPHAEPAVKSASGTSALIHDQRREAARQPTETPRKHAISTMLVKNVRNMTVLPSQRMHASSKKRIKKLIKKSSRLAQCAGQTASARVFWIRGADRPSRTSESLLETITANADDDRHRASS